MNNRKKRIPLADFRKLSGELATVLDGTEYGILRLSEKIPFRSEVNGCMLIAVSASRDDKDLFIDCKRHSDDIDLIEVPIEEVYLDMAHSSENEDKLLSVLRRSVVESFLTPAAEGIFERHGDGRLYLVDQEGYESYLNKYPYEAGKDPGINGKIRISGASVVYVDRKAEGEYVLGLNNSFNPQFERDILQLSLPEIYKLSEQLKEYNPGTLKKRAEVNSSELEAADIIGKVFANLLHKGIRATDCLVLLTQEMADHIFQLYMKTDDMTNIKIPFDGELTKGILDSHVGEYVWMESFYEPVTDICSHEKFPRPFRLMFADQMTEMGLFSLGEILYMIQDSIMDVYYAIMLLKYNNMNDSEIIQILSKAKLPEIDFTGALSLEIKPQ